MIKRALFIYLFIYLFILLWISLSLRNKLEDHDAKAVILVLTERTLSSRFCFVRAGRSSTSYPERSHASGTRMETKV